MRGHSRLPAGLSGRFWLESVLAACAAGLALLSLVVPDWIEVMFGIEPDAGSGALEWIVVLVFAAVAVACAVLARTQWRQARLAST